MIKKLWLILIIFWVSPVYACNVEEANIFHRFDYLSGDSNWVLIDFFWEHGNYIFNFISHNGEYLVGGWKYFNCKIEIEFQENDIEKKRTIKINSLQDGILILEFPNQPGEAKYVQFHA